MNRQERWSEKGYTSKQIECHLQWERTKNRQSREQNKSNNKENQDLIKQIKQEIVGKTFDNIKVLRIAPTNDGKGFWFHVWKKFNDGSEGKFRYFERFDDYEYKDFIKELKYL